MERPCDDGDTCCLVDGQFQRTDNPANRTIQLPKMVHNYQTETLFLTLQSSIKNITLEEKSTEKLIADSLNKHQ